jgi:hypothetical protein
MRSRRPRLALLGVLALALTVTVGLVSGSVADAKKNKKSANVATVSNNTPRAIPDRAAGVGTTYGRLDTNLTVGKKFKGKSVGTLELTFQTTGNSADASDDVRFDIIAPNGYRLPWNWTDNNIDNSQNIGPLTITPNSPFRTCDLTTTCSDPFQTLHAPYVGTVGDNTFQWFRGLPMKGVWDVVFLDSSSAGSKTSILNKVQLKLTAA